MHGIELSLVPMNPQPGDAQYYNQVKTAQMPDQQEQLLSRVAAGDEEALRDIYRQFERPLFALGYRWCGDRAIAEELVQEVTVRVWRRAGTFDPERGAASSWIFGIARNVASDLLRSHSRDPQPVDVVPIVDSQPWDEQEAWRAWEVAQAMRHLPIEQQKVVELAFVCQFTHTEIARTLDIPLGTVKTRIQLALSKLEREFVMRGLVEVIS